MSDKLEEYRQKVVGTNIDQKSLLATDYFNTFNSVAMILEMLPDAPERLEEVEQWQYYDYVQHFQASGLDFAPLAIEAYEYVPPDLKTAFENKIANMHSLIVDAAQTLRAQHDAGNTEGFASFCRETVTLYHAMREEGDAIVHGHNDTLSQEAIDSMF